MGEKKQIKISVKDKIACLLDEEQFLVCGNNDYDVVFDFDSDWDGISAKTAVFVYGDTPIHQPFTENICKGVEIKNATICAIGVFAGNIKTTTGAVIKCKTSVRDLGGVPKPPSEEVYDEIMVLLDKAIQAHTELPTGGKKGQVLKKQSDEDYDTYWEDDEQRDLTQITNSIKKLDTDIKTAKNDMDTLQEKVTWDYVIADASDFTTEKLATMSGRVLVKGVTVPNTYPDFPRRVVELPPSISLIKFIDSKMYAYITASVNGTTEISGFVGFYASFLGGGSFTELRNFKKVESCTGYPQLYNCSNIRNSAIHGAINCQFIDNVHCLADRGDGYYHAFVDCIVLSNITFDQLYSEDSEHEIDFLNCKHLSNIHALNSNVIINYQGCLYVDGDTCDGYYTAEDVGQVQTVNTDGSNSLIEVVEKISTPYTFYRVYAVDDTGAEDTVSVDWDNTAVAMHIPRRNDNLSIYIPNEPVEDTDAVNKAYVDGVMGDISTILTALHEGGIE